MKKVISSVVNIKGTLPLSSSLDCSAEYRRCVAVFVLQQESGQYFAAERINEAGAWQIPQGGVEINEDDAEAASRELWEETGISSVEILKSTKVRYNYDFPEQIIAKRQKRGWKYFRGQSVKFFLMKFLGKESEINLKKVPDSVEFSHWRWMDAKDIIEQSVGFKKETIQLGAMELGII